MAPAAVRIPDPRHTSVPFDFSALGPQIFIHEGARQALERRLELAFGGPVQLAVTDNLRRMVTHTRVRGTRRVRVHMMFLGAPERVRLALVEYVVSGDRRASVVLGDFIADNGHRIRASRPVTGPLRTRGRSHDLAEVLAAVNAQYFGGAMGDVLVTWGRNTRPARQGPQHDQARQLQRHERLIRVHPALDREWVPRYFLSYIVFHELLHHLIQPVHALAPAGAAAARAGVPVLRAGAHVGSRSTLGGSSARSNEASDLRAGRLSSTQDD